MLPPCFHDHQLNSDGFLVDHLGRPLLELHLVLRHLRIPHQHLLDAVRQIHRDDLHLDEVRQIHLDDLHPNDRRRQVHLDEVRQIHLDDRHLDDRHLDDLRRDDLDHLDERPQGEVRQLRRRQDVVQRCLMKKDYCQHAVVAALK
jgi:hypothetical protein